MSDKNVTIVRKDVTEQDVLWQTIRDVLDGEHKVKAATTRYLPQPNPTDTSKENKERYVAYLLRAVFYNATARTVQGLSGHVFAKDPTVTLPETLSFLVENVDGNGTPLLTFGKCVLESVLAFNRAGILSDFTSTQGTATLEDIRTGKIRPRLLYYRPEQIINWRVSGESKTLLMLVLKEDEEVVQDEFVISTSAVYRVYRKEDDGRVSVQVYRRPESARLGQTGDVAQVVPDAKQYITDAAGKPFTEIPFSCLSLIGNSMQVLTPPIMDLVNINLGHYRNSADYEESVFQVGQPTPWVSGLSEQWVKNVLGGVLRLGSRSAIPLPNGAQCGLLQAQPNTLVAEAMQMKQDQMIALGAKLVQDRTVQRTAKEAGIENATELSVLTAAALAVSMGVQRALRFAGMWVSGVDPNKIVYELNKDFALSNMTAEERNTLMTEWQGGAISFGEMREGLRRAGVAFEKDEDVKREAEEMIAAGAQLGPAKGATPPEQDEDEGEDA